MAIIRNGAGRELYPVGTIAVDEGTLEAGNSPLVIAVATLLTTDTQTRNGNRGWIANDSTSDSPASFTVEIAHTGTTYMTAFTLAQGEVLDLTGFDIATIRLTRVGADCAYRVVAY